jgi:hypothetical protein
MQQVVLRGFEQRSDPVPLRYGGPDYFAEVGSIDLPPIAIDLIRRNKLGVSPGSAVYVRASFASLLFEEMSAVFLLLAAIFIGTLAQANIPLTVIICIAYVSLVLALAIRRFR